jgi:hypothetical protein
VPREPRPPVVTLNGPSVSISESFGRCQSNPCAAGQDFVSQAEFGQCPNSKTTRNVFSHGPHALASKPTAHPPWA